ncbi:MAG TPA: alkaline phosphatase family protein, partial [Rubrobacteraceae bacterium]|nr:alkaline phosphatase family protein [Rubrobacteraceae bacterium]
MPELVLGPLLRHVGASDATFWVETNSPCEVEVRAGRPSTRSPTFRVGSHHYALVHVTGLTPGVSHEYEVRLDGEVVWPEPSSPFPPSVVRVPGEGELVKLVFGSCRISAPHE